MPSVMCIAGLDPSGYAGLSADMRALGFLGIRCFPIASTLTVQNRESFTEFQPVPVDLIEKQIYAVINTEKPDAIKIGVLGSAEIAMKIAEILDSLKVPSVVDPVFASSTGYSLLDEDMLGIYKNDLIPASHLVTPNAHEASILSGINVHDPETAAQAGTIILDLGPDAVLVKGGHFKKSVGTDIFCDSHGTIEVSGRKIAGKVRGTGCTYSSLIAGYLSMGTDTPKAVRHAKSDLARVLEISAGKGDSLACFENIESGENLLIRTEFNSAISKIIATMPSMMVAEVGNNMAYAKDRAAGYGDVCTLDSRIVHKNGRPATLGTPVFGRESQIARVVLAAMAKDPGIRCAMNLRFSTNMLAMMKDAGFRIGTFDRSEEPDSSSPMEWGTGKAINDLGYVPDAIYCLGSVGKEPMIQVLAENPRELVLKLEKLTESWK